MPSSSRSPEVVFYVPLWKRDGITLAQFDDYWRDVHGPVCARLPGQMEYWQFHLSPYEGGLFPAVDGCPVNNVPEDQFMGVAELTFSSVEDRATWFQASTILMDDEHNIFSKAIGYTTSLGNTVTLIDNLSEPYPNGIISEIRYHVMIRKADSASVDQFRSYISDQLMTSLSSLKEVAKLRYHLFDEIDLSRPDAQGVEHVEKPGKDYHACFEIAFASALDRETVFSDSGFLTALAKGSDLIDMIKPSEERFTATFVAGHKMTLAGARGSSVSQLITGLGALNQIRDDINDLMLYNKL